MNPERTLRGSVLIEERIRRPKGRIALIPYVVAGDPDVQYSLRTVTGLAEFSDAIEIGLPYSDPLADGPAIQAGSMRALKSGMNLPRALELIRKSRSETDVPLIVFTYANPVIQFGLEEFARACREAGADGVIVPDLPHEESGALRTAAAREGLAAIPLIALTSRARVEKIAAQATGFAYCVSSLGVTGERGGFPQELRPFVEAVKAVSPVPVAVGFGISRPEQVAELADYADGAIVGSALVRRSEGIASALEAGDEAEAEQRLGELLSFARSLSIAGNREGGGGH